MTCTKIDDNLELIGDGIVQCRHCNQAMGTAHDVLTNAIWREAEPHLEDGILSEAPSHFVDEPVVMRSAFCPRCLTLLSHEIVPKGEPYLRAISLF